MIKIVVVFASLAYLAYGHIRGKEGILIFGGINNNDNRLPDPYFQLVNPPNHENVTITTVWANRPAYDMAAVSYYDGYRHDVFVTGGHTLNGGIYLRNTFIFDILSNNIRCGPKMAKGRGHHASVIDFGKVLYVFGGLGAPEGGSKHPTELNTCERMKATLQFGPFFVLYRWTGCAPMPRSRWGFSAVLAKDKIYLFGGLTNVEDPKIVAEVDEYDVKNDKWSTVKSLPTPRHSEAAVRFNDVIFVCGGTADNKTPSNQCDVYDPDTDTWKENYVSMVKARFSPRMVVFSDVLYVLGGSEKIGAVLSSIEYYDPATNTFNLIKEEISNAKFFFAAVAVQLK